MKLLSILLLYMFQTHCLCYKILVVSPIPSKSHAILGEGILGHLSKAGHELTYLTAIKMHRPIPNVTEIVVHTNEDLIKDCFNLAEIMETDHDGKEMNYVFDMMCAIANNTIMYDDVQKLILDTDQYFDVIILEWMYTELYSGFAAVFDCPYIWFSSMEVHSMILSTIDDIPNPAYTPANMSEAAVPLTFWERVFELIMMFKTLILRWAINRQEQIIYQNGFGPAVAKRDRVLPPYDEIKYNASLVLGNAHVSTGQANRLPPSFIPIAGFHIDEKIAALPTNLQKIMDDAQNGVIYFSLGTILKLKTLPPKLMNSLISMFGSLNQTVLWKTDEVYSDLPKNVHMLDWAPQRSILAHPNCKVFITHGGLLSTTEAIHFGVPIIGIPAFADQYINVNRAVKKGFALLVNLKLNLPVKLKLAIEEILSNSKYSTRVKELSVVYHDRPMPPGKELVYWTEHVVRTRGAAHLRSPALLHPWYQKLYLDLAALLFVALITMFVLLKKIKRIADILNSTKRTLRKKLD